MTPAKKSKEEITEQNDNELVDCFVIMPISNQLGYESGHFQLVFEDIICPAIKLAGMNPKRADNVANTNLIQLDILNSIINSPMAICDMSARNPNVFYELGMRQAFDMPTVLLRDNETDAPFDISGLRYVTYSKSMSYRSVNDAIAKLSDAIQQTYEKRNDKSEVNSLIRLLELNSATIKPVNVTEVERNGILNNLMYQELLTKIGQISDRQDEILKDLTPKPMSREMISNSWVSQNPDALERIRERYLNNYPEANKGFFFANEKEKKKP